MYVASSLFDGSQAAIVLREGQDVRLSSTCFRGTDLRLAGNFSRWDNAYALLTDDLVHEQLMIDVLETADDDCALRVQRRSVTISHNVEVGWESTDTIRRYHDIVLEPFYPNGKTHALRVRLNRKDIRAPRTKNVTIVYELRFDEGGWVVIVQSIYPGVDIGRLKGNVTEREGRVFFDWNHPGA